MIRSIFILAVLAFFNAACGTSTPVSTAPASASPTAVISPTPPPSESPATPTLTPTPPVFSGTLTTQVNVRSGPGMGYESLGLLNSGQTVQVSLHSEDGHWYRIHYPAAVDGIGWVSAQYVTFAEGTPFFATAPSQPAQELPSGRVLQRLNVRSGPGTNFETLGMLEADTVVVLTAKNSTAAWFQIVYPAGTAQRGWVTAQFIQTDSSASLPILDEFGTPVSAGTPGPTAIPMTPTPTTGPASEDGDSSANPAVRVIFLSSGTRRFTYYSQVSAPAGDSADWLEFTPFSSLPGEDASLRFSLTCAGNGTLSVELFQAGAALPAAEALECGSRDKTLVLPAAIVTQLRISIVAEDGLRLVQYALSIENLP